MGLIALIRLYFFNCSLKATRLGIFLACLFSVLEVKSQTQEELNADWQQACKVIRDIHPAVGLYFTGSQIDSLEAAVLTVNRLPDKRALYRSLCKLMSELACVHSTAVPTPAIMPAELYPETGSFNIKAGKLFYHTEGHQDEITGVGGRPWAEVFTEMKALFPGDGPHSGYPNAVAGLNPTYSMRRVIYPNDSIAFETSTGNGKTIRFNKNPEALITKGKRMVKEIELFKNKGASDTIYMSLPSFGSSISGKDIKRCLRTIAENRPKVLLMDLRYNTGGSFPKALALAAEFSDSTINLKSRQLKRIQLRKHIPLFSRFIAKYTVFWSALVKGGRPKRDKQGFYYSYKIPPKGNGPKYCDKLIILTGPFTLSAGSMAASYLKHYGKAEVWGLPTGGTASGSQGTHIFEVKLKHSGFKIEVPLSRLEHEIKTTKPGDLVMPDKSNSAIPSSEKIRANWTPIILR